MARAVKAQWPHVPVGVITGTPEVLLEQRGAPVDFVLFKPVSLEALQDALSRVRP